MDGKTETTEVVCTRCGLPATETHPMSQYRATHRGLAECFEVTREHAIATLEADNARLTRGIEAALNEHEATRILTFRIEELNKKIASLDAERAGVLDRIEGALEDLRMKYIDKYNAALGMMCTETWVMMPDVYGIIRKERATLTPTPRRRPMASEETRKLIEQCRAALAEELAAYDGFEIAHVREAHDAAVAWLERTLDAERAGVSVTDAMVDAAWAVLVDRCGNDYDGDGRTYKHLIWLPDKDDVRAAIDAAMNLTPTPEASDGE